MPDALFDAPVRLAAAQLLDAGRISDVRILQQGRIVTGMAHPDPARADQPTAHRVYIRYRPAGSSSRGSTFEGECSCGGSSPCAHVAAVALFAARQAGSRQTATAPADPRRETGDAAARSAGQRLCYALEPTDRGCCVSLWVAQIAADRADIPDGARPFARRPSGDAEEYPRYVDDDDRRILGMLPRQSPDRWQLQGASGFALLQQLVATGRAAWQTPLGRTLRPGAARELSLEWRTAATGEQRLQAAAAAGSLHVLVGLEPAAYVDEARNECGALQPGCGLALLRLYWNRPIAPEEVADVDARLAREPGAAGLPRPRALVVLRQPLTTLRGNLTLSAGPRATVDFLYNGQLIAAGQLKDGDGSVRRLDGVVYEIPRDPDAEHALHAELDAVMRDAPQSPDAWLHFLLAGVPTLRERGWTIRIDEDFPYRMAPRTGWYADLSSHRRADWFDLQLGVLVDGRPVNLLPALVDYLEATSAGAAAPSLQDVEHRFILLEDGRYLPVPTQRLRRIAETLVELFDRDVLHDRCALSLPQHQAGRVALLAQGEEEGAPLLRSDDASLLARVEAIRGFAAVEPLPAPAGCRATLRDYQAAGLGWLQHLRLHRLGGILADDMGLGKTLQTLAHLAVEKAAGRLLKPALIVAPVSVTGNWRREVRRFTPALTAVVLQGAKRRALFAQLQAFDIVIIGYASLLFDAEVLLEREFSVVIFDEAQTLKNPHAKLSRAARLLRAEQRLCLTGTPMENHLGDLWSLCDLVQPGLLGTEQSFQRQYRTPIEKSGSTCRAEALRRRLAPFVLRRTKDAVARELPAKTEIVESIVLDERQRDFYDGIRLSMQRRVREAIQQQGLARSRITVLDALLRLRQACCEPRLIAADERREAMPSAKLDWLSTALPELIADGRRILLFPQFTSMLRLIETLVTGLTIPYCLLTGDTQDRPAVIERFQAGEVPLFLLSLKAGGAGLNLTAADTVIHYDPWWNPAIEAQATDRAHRIGQDKPVFVYKLIAERTVEEKSCSFRPTSVRWSASSTRPQTPRPRS